MTQTRYDTSVAADLTTIREAIGVGSTRRFVPAGNRMGTTRTVTSSGGGSPMMTSRLHRAPNLDLTNLRLIVPWWKVDLTAGELAVGNGATVKAAIHFYADGGARLPFQKDGQSNMAVNDLQTLVSDAVGGYLPANSFYRLPTFVDPGVGGFIPYGRNCLRLDAGSLTGFAGSDSAEFPGTDKVMTGTTTTTAGNDSAFEGILVGETRQYVPSFGGIGDSRMNGVDELDVTNQYKGRANAGDAYGNIGWFERLFGGAGYPHINMGQSGSKTQVWALAGAMSRRSYVLGLTCSHLVIQLVHNDLATRTASQIIADLQAIVNNGKTFAQKVWVCTDMPSTTSTDGFATAENQTVTAFEGVRQTVNAAIRAGIPGAAGYIDLDGVVRDPVITYAWKGGLTIDGVHGNGACQILIASTLRATDYV